GEIWIFASERSTVARSVSRGWPSWPGGSVARTSLVSAPDNERDRRADPGRTREVQLGVEEDLATSAGRSSGDRIARTKCGRRVTETARARWPRADAATRWPLHFNADTRPACLANCRRSITKGNSRCSTASTAFR